MLYKETATCDCYFQNNEKIIILVDSFDFEFVTLKISKIGQ